MLEGTVKMDKIACAQATIVQNAIAIFLRQSSSTSVKQLTVDTLARLVSTATMDYNGSMERID